MVTCAGGFVKNMGRGYPGIMETVQRLPILLLLALSGCALPVADTPHALTPTAAASPTPEPSATWTPFPTATAAPVDSLMLGDRALLNGDYPAAMAHYNTALL